MIIAIGALHKLGVIHRDIKFENILLNEEGNLVLIDYGLAVFLDKFDSQNLPTDNVGNCLHKAPEVYAE